MVAVVVAVELPLVVAVGSPLLARLALEWILGHLAHHLSLLAGLGHLVPELGVAAHREVVREAPHVPAAGQGYSADLG